MSVNVVERIDDRVKVRHVLVSVSDKQGLERFIPELVRVNPGLRIFSTGGTFSHIQKLLGDAAGRHLTQVSDYTGPARDAGRAGEDPGLQDLPRPALRDLQPGAPGRPAAHRRGADRHGGGQPLPLPGNRSRRPGATPEEARGEHRHRRPVHDARRGQELPSAWPSVVDPADYPAIVAELAAQRRRAARSPPASAWRRRPSRTPPSTTRPSPATWAALPPDAGRAPATRSADAREGRRERARTSRPPTAPIMDDHFPDSMEISFVRRGETPDPRLREGHLGHRRGGEGPALRREPRPGGGPVPAGQRQPRAGRGARPSSPGRYLASDVELLQSGKHPGKINITDVGQRAEHPALLHATAVRGDREAQQPLRRGAGRHAWPRPTARPTWPTGSRPSAGAIALNREVDRETAELIAAAVRRGGRGAPSSPRGSWTSSARRKNLRVMRIAAMDRLAAVRRPRRFVDFKSLIDGGLVAQWSFVPGHAAAGDFLPAEATYKGKEYRVDARAHADAEHEDLLFGWLVEAGVTTNSVLYVKDGATVGHRHRRAGPRGRGRDRPRQGLPQARRPLCWETPRDRLQRPDGRGPEGRDRRARWRRQKGGLIGRGHGLRRLLPVPRRGGRRPPRRGHAPSSSPGGSERDYRGRSRRATRRAWRWCSPASARSSIERPSLRQAALPGAEGPLSMRLFKGSGFSVQAKEHSPCRGSLSLF